MSLHDDDPHDALLRELKRMRHDAAAWRALGSAAQGARVKTKKPVAEPDCPCGSGHGYRACCGRHLDAGVPAPTAEALMRSRYSAYVAGREDYLLSTWHASTRPTRVELEPPAKWLELRVLRHVPDPADADRAIVEFVARFRAEGRGHRLHETSRFVREAGRWFYLDAKGDDR
jgi:SEC-C motif-containing protein